MAPIWQCDRKVLTYWSVNYNLRPWLYTIQAGPPLFRSCLYNCARVVLKMSVRLCKSDHKVVRASQCGRWLYHLWYANISTSNSSACGRSCGNCSDFFLQINDVAASTMAKCKKGHKVYLPSPCTLEHFRLPLRFQHCLLYHIMNGCVWWSTNQPLFVYTMHRSLPYPHLKSKLMTLILSPTLVYHARMECA